ncbi:MAG: hypothetical protein Q9163_005886 [Psora crenata]
MSALGSTVINKSGKKFAPKKAPIRRPAGPESTQGSSRPSVDRQVQSQTPQPQPAVYQIESSPAPSLTFPSPAAPQELIQSVQTAPSRDPNAIRIEIPAVSTQSPKRSSAAAVISRKRSLDACIGSTPSTSSTAPILAHTAPGLGPASPINEPITLDNTTQKQPLGIVQGECPIASSQESDIQVREQAAPPSKRRRTKIAQAHTGTSNGSTVGPNVPLPTTEADEAAAKSIPSRGTIARRKRTSTKQSKNLNHVAFRESADRTLRPPTDPPEHNDHEPTIENQDGEDAQMENHKRRRRLRKRVLQDAAAEIVQDAAQRSVKGRKNPGRRSKRLETPEGAENITIAPSATKMIELCRDCGIGRKSIREQELREMDRAAFVKKKQGELREMMGQAALPDRAVSGESARARDSGHGRQREQEEDIVLNVPNTIVVNGQIQIDEESLQIDRHAAAAVARNMEELEPIDENDLTRKVTSGSWLKRDKSGGWNEILLDRFYQGLRMFGTDFELISKMFPGKTRHAIKLKFCREEKLDYPRIKAALTGERLPVVLEEYEKITGIEYEDPENLNRVMEEDRKKLEEEQAAEKDAMEAAIREREAQAADERKAATQETGKENQLKRKNQKSVKKGKGIQQERRTRKNELGLGA